MIYLDNAATTKIRKEVKEAMLPIFGRMNTEILPAYMNSPEMLTLR